MAVIELLRRRRSPAEEGPGPTQLIGTADDFFPCPKCTRPVGPGETACSACGTRVLLRVEMRRALFIGGIGVAVGLFLGAPLGGLMVGIVGGGSAAGHPGATIAPSPTLPGGSGGDAGTIVIPPAISTALSQTVTINNRLNSSLASLKTLRLGRTKVDPIAVADVFRTIATTANLGAAVAPKLGGWAPTSDLGLNLASLYTAATNVAREALGNSVTNEPAYRAAALTMIRALAVLPDLSTKAEQLSVAGVVVIPPSADASGDPVVQ